MIPAPRPDIEMPAPPAFDRMAIPPVAAITPAAKDDPVPPQLSGTQTAPPPTTSPGANDSQIEEVLFAVEPGTARIPASAEARLQAIARDMASDPAARLEIRTFSPTRAHSESTARRLSLARFLAIRDSLKRQGVDEGRVDGRPLASTPDELNADRVELYVEH
jgi:outer membrane protein OmpA-like peptidoglycan-associated protein